MRRQPRHHLDTGSYHYVSTPLPPARVASAVGAVAQVVAVSAGCATRGARILKTSSKFQSSILRDMLLGSFYAWLFVIFALFCARAHLRWLAPCCIRTTTVGNSEFRLTLSNFRVHTIGLLVSHRKVGDPLFLRA